MKRIVIIIVIGIVVIFALTRLFSKPKKGTATKETTVKRTKQTAKTSGQLKTKTKEELAEEKKKARVQARALKRELRKRQRAEKRAAMLRSKYGDGYQSRVKGRRRGGTTGARTGRKGTVQLYQLKAIFTVENINYALIDSRQVQKGDDIMGREIVEILTDRIIIDESGRHREVRIGESVLPNLITPKRRTTR